MTTKQEQTRATQQEQTLPRPSAQRWRQRALDFARAVPSYTLSLDTNTRNTTGTNSPLPLGTRVTNVSLKQARATQQEQTLPRTSALV